MKPSVLIFAPAYLPGYKLGGTILSISNLVEGLSREIDFRVVTADRDTGDDKPYPSIREGVWTEVGPARVKYLSPGELGLRSIFRLLASEKADCLYLNSFCNRPFSILPMVARQAGARAQRRVVLAPRGEFAPAALQMKRGRKQAWINIASRMAVYRNALWQASSAFEEEDIRRVWGGDARSREIAVASDLPQIQPIEWGPALFKESGSLRVVFLARITPMKNLLAVIRMLRQVSGNVAFNIYGPVADAAYWSECEERLKSLPSNVRVGIHSHVEQSKVREVLATHHVFVMPSLGENFGHGIYEALSAGLPVIISDRTPWRGLKQSGGGWDLPLDREDLFHSAIETCIAMDNERYQTASASARALARGFQSDDSLLRANRALFIR